MRHVTWGRSGMYVIFPAEELILMTYGAAIPRISPRPTLDCLREPKVPIFLPARSKPPPKNNNIVVPVFAQLPQPVLLPITVPIQEAVVHTSSGEFNNLPPLPPKRSSLASLSRGSSIVPKATVTFSTATSLNTINSNTILPSRAPMYNDLNMQSPTPSSSSEPNTRRVVRGSTPLRLPATPPTSASSTLRVIPDDEELPSSLDYPKRERSPSIRLDLLPPDDPTRPKLGPGWGRPMSPMDLPPEPSTSAASTKSPKLRLKPKLHIPLGKLGRSASAEPKESNRLREDLQLHIENPIFKAENLRQRNFDVFFDAGEPVYKLQPKAPSSAPGDNPSDQYAGLYDSTLSRKVDRKGGSGGLFARSPREDKLLATPAKSTDVNVEPLPRGRASSVEPAAFSSGYASTGSSTGGDGGRTPQKDFLGKSSSGRKNRSFFGWRGPRCGSLDPPTTSNSMASYTGVLKDYGHISLNEALKSQNSINFKLIKTVSDFTESLSQLYEEHATALQTLVSNYRKKNAELRKERPSCHLSIFQAWETFMQEVETDSHASTDVATALSRQVSRPLLDKSFHRKVQSRKLFTHRESFETILAKTEEKLTKCRVDYKQCYLKHRQNPTQNNLSEYVDAHNAYVQQLHATNAMLETYHCDTAPQLMQELEEIHNDLYGIIADSILLGADFIANKATDQAKRYGNLTTQCNSISPSQDLQNFVHVLPLPPQAQKVPKRVFVPPQQPLLPAALVSSSGGSGVVVAAPAAIVDNDDNKDDLVATLRNELVYDRQSSVGLRAALEALKREAIDLEMQIRQLQDAVESLNRTQVRGIEGQLYNKVNEMQEELSIKKFDLRAKQLHLAAIKAQKELFISKVEPGSPRAERKFSTAATPPSMKTKWLKAIKSLKPASGSAAPTDRRNGAAGASSQTVRPTEDGSHHLQEYTYKKITACDVCSQILRGHTRQGLRCRICKLNAHGDCAAQLPRCQPKQKLLRRQKSTSELENRIEAEEEIDEDLAKNILTNTEASPMTSKKFRQKTPFIDRITKLELTDIQQVYRALKQASDLKNSNHHITAEKSVQSVSKEGGSQTTDIPIVHVPDYPERSDRPAATGSSSAGTSVHRESAASGSGRGVVVMRPGIRPPPVAMPILGVQLQQQELQRSGLGGGGVPTIAGVVSAALPVPAQDLSSSSASATTSVSSTSQLSTTIYPSGGRGFKYNYAAAAPTLSSSAQAAKFYEYSANNQQFYQRQHQSQLYQEFPSGGGAATNVVGGVESSQMRRRLFAGFRPSTGLERSAQYRLAQNRSISLPETPHSPRRQKLNLRMKSLSLDSPESTELHGQMRRRQQQQQQSYQQQITTVLTAATTSMTVASTTGGAAAAASDYYPSGSGMGSGSHLDYGTPPSNSSRLHSPSSPSHQGRKLLYATRGMRGGSMDLPDEMEKSQSSASTSPCPSPKSHRLLPTNLYVVLYNFKARHADELDLKAGYKVTVIDTSDPDWWKGKAMGRMGYFPSKYVVRLNANEKPLQVTHNLQVSDGERGDSMTLLRDQIVIQAGDELNGMVLVRAADNRQGYCPAKYLQEV